VRRKLTEVAVFGAVLVVLWHFTGPFPALLFVIAARAVWWALWVAGD